MQEGTVVAAHGRQYVVEIEEDGRSRRLHCFPRGKKSEVACGDRVQLSLPSADQGCIESIIPRKTLLYRSNEFRQKLIAANLTQVVIVVASEPPFSEEVLTRCLIAAESEGLTTLIVLNKCDLIAETAAAEVILKPFEKLGYRLLRLTATQDVDELRNALQNHTSVLVGQSGMGKSTIVNTLIPEARAATREISEALQSGKHTTTHAALYQLERNHNHHTWLIDSPGLQEFGLAHLSVGEIEQAMPEFRPYHGKCRFNDCRHSQEPGCAIRAAVTAGQISTTRHATFLKLTLGK